MNDKKQERAKKIFVAGGVMAAVVIVGVVIYALTSWVLTVGKADVLIAYAPFTATVKLNGKVLANNSNHYLSPGVYRLEVELENFEPILEDVEIDENTKFLFAGLNAANDEGEKYAKEHMNDYLSIEGIAGYLSNESGILIRERNLTMAPVVANLPVKNSLFDIGYVADENEVKIIISTSDTYMDEAVKKFKSLLSDDEQLSRYDIEFLGFDNVLQGVFEDNDGADPVDYLYSGFMKISNFDVVDGGEFEDYYYAKVTTGTTSTYSLVTYKLILKDTNNGWELVGEPMPILTRYNTDDVPDEVLNLANWL